MTICPNWPKRATRSAATRLATITAALALAAFPSLLLTRGLEARRSDEAQQTSSTRPDVIIVLTDQQRADAFGAGGAADIHTPAMDRLARQGVLFTNAFAATPQCSPSRAALLTGRYPHRTGVVGNTAGEGNAAPTGPPPAGMSGALDRSLPTLGRLFTAAGYETGYFGKWHLGGTPGDYGFETHDARINDATLASRVVEFLQKRGASPQRRPLLLVVSWLNPHDIYGVLNEPAPDARALGAARLPSNLIDDLENKPSPQRQYLREDQGRPFLAADKEMWRRYRAFYNQLVEAVDRQIGTVLDALELSKVKSKVPAITVFSSDHGDLGGAHGLPYKGPAMYEELVRVPLVISWPGTIRPARSDALVSLIDVLPTVCDLAGVPPASDIDGISLRPLLDNDKRATEVHQTIFAEYYGKQSWRVPIRMARTARWKYVRYAGYGEELYDLAADPGELRNLARDPSGASIEERGFARGEERGFARGEERGFARERTRLARELDEWIRRARDPFPDLTATDRSGKPLPKF